MQMSLRSRREARTSFFAASMLIVSSHLIVADAQAANRPPTISGTPAKGINVGKDYFFKPVASDPEGANLKFSITNRPNWSSFRTSNGRLSGTPTAAHVGNYSGIVISVSDGKTSASLPAFTISVTQSSMGSATLSWLPPTQNADGSVLVNLSGYRIHYGTSSSALNQTTTLNNPGLTRYVVEDLSPATYYFALKALTSSGTESALSKTVSKTIP